MTINEVFTEITSKTKWYNQVGVSKYCEQQTAAALIKRHKEGKVRFETYVRLFEHFGYYQTGVNFIKEER